MALNFGQNLFPPRRDLVTSYDYIDASNGMGYDVYYGFNMNGTTGTSTISAVYSGLTHYNGVKKTTSDEDTTEMLDIDFDILFNKPKNIRGKIYVQIPFGVVTPDAAEIKIDMWATATAYHYDGSSEVIMGSAATSVRIQNASLTQSEPGSWIDTLIIDQATVKHFKKGEILRITVKVFTYNDSGGSANIVGGIGTDPKNRTDTDVNLQFSAGNMDEQQIIEDNKPTQLAIHVPFVIDI